MVSKNLYTYPQYSSDLKDSKNISYVEVHFKKNDLLTPNSKPQRGLNMTFLYDKTIFKINRSITKKLTNELMEINLFDNRLKGNTTHSNTFLVESFYVSNIKQ